MKRRVVIITGLSGSGKSTGARVLEDNGFFVVDNLPLVMLPDFLDRTDRGYDRVAAVVDARSSEFLSGFADILASIRREGHQVDVVFFEASDQDLVRRYSETRRRHPLVQREGIAGAIHRERVLMAELRRAATAIIDSSGISVHQLRRQVLATLFGPEPEDEQLQVQVVSFGYRHGLPMEADLVFDVRFLDNPHFVPELQPLSGQDPPVRDFVLQQADCQVFLEKLRDLLKFLVPRYRQEGKSSLTIALGCTGGRHRSVALAETLRPYLAGAGYAAEVNHRDLGKGEQT